MFAHVNGIDLFYEKIGEGRPLIMVHGNSEDHTIFDKAAEILKENFTCYLVDSRGHGQSTPVDILHYDDMAEDMICFMDELDLQDVVFYGFSDGGIIGLIAASKCPRIAKLITNGANCTPEGVKKSLTILIKFFNAFHKDPKFELMLHEPHISDDTLRSIRAKTLVLAGSRDLILEKETRHIADVIPRAKLRILQGEGHGSYIVHKTKIARIIQAFAKEKPKKDSTT